MNRDSFFSECCTIRTSEIARGRRATSLNWWENYAPKFDLYISREVVRELSSPDFPDAVRELHRELLRAGAEVMVAFTYYGHREKLRMIGREAVVPGPNR